MTRGTPFRYTVVVSSYHLQYFTLYTPLFDRRLAITLGHAMPTPDEIAASEAQSLRDDPTHTALPPVSPGTTPSVKHDLITNRDAEALKHLMDIRMSYLTEGHSGDAAGALAPGRWDSSLHSTFLPIRSSRTMCSQRRTSTGTSSGMRVTLCTTTRWGVRSSGRKTRTSRRV